MQLEQISLFNVERFISARRVTLFGLLGRQGLLSATLPLPSPTPPPGQSLF